MSTIILDYEIDQIPDKINGLEDYQQAYIVIRLHRKPLIRVYANVHEGILSAAELRKTILKATDETFWKNWWRVYLQGSSLVPPDRQPLPASVAVCTRDRPNDLLRCLQTLINLPTPPAEILVVDSASTGSDTKHVVEMFEQVRYLREELPGLNRARNRALDEARYSIVVFCDDDTFPEPEWLHNLTTNFYDPTVLCVTGLTLPMELEVPSQEWFERFSSFGRGFQPRVFHLQNINPLAAGIVGAGANMALHKSIISRVGYFDDTLDAGTPTRSGGDTEMFSRIIAAGYRIKYEPAAINWHRHRESWAELRNTIYGYGVGTYAFWTKKLLFEGETNTIYLALNWLFGYQIPDLIRSIFRMPDCKPLDLLLAELAGCFAGPWLYLVSRRKISPSPW